MVIADTGFWLALLNRRDAVHKRACAALKEINEPLITTVPVLTETTYLVLARLGWPTLIRFIESLDEGLAELFQIQEDHLAQIALLMRKYRDLPMDLADASLIIVAEKLGHGRILSTDQRDFKAYRWKNTKPFENLLEG